MSEIDFVSFVGFLTDRGQTIPQDPLENERAWQRFRGEPETPRPRDYKPKCKATDCRNIGSQGRGMCQRHRREHQAQEVTR